MNLYAYNSHDSNNDIIILTFLPPDYVEKGKLNQNQVIGYLWDKNLPPIHSNIIYNQKFVDFFHKTVVFTSLNNPACIEAAKMQQNGFIYITDQRVPESNEPEDIIGSFEVKDGQLLQHTYMPNTKYEMVSKNGLFVLNKEFEAVFMHALVGLNQ